MSKTALCAPNLRTSLASLACESVHCGLNQGTSGNVSVRSREGYLITPSGQNMAALTADDMVEMTLAGEVVGAGKPSSEWRFHRDIYATFAAAEAIVHAHSPFAAQASQHSITWWRWLAVSTSAAPRMPPSARKPCRMLCWRHCRIAVPA